MPLILWSIQNAFPQGSKENSTIRSYREGLEKQFFEKVLVVKNDQIYLNNYMSGDNGVFRWEYPSLGKGKGYKPYGLTASFGMGWWTFLPSKRIKDLYLRYFKQLDTSNKQLGCNALMNDIIKGKKGSHTFKTGECIYLYNSYLASKIKQN